MMHLFCERQTLWRENASTCKVDTEENKLIFTNESLKHELQRKGGQEDAISRFVHAVRCHPSSTFWLTRGEILIIELHLQNLW